MTVAKSLYHHETPRAASGEAGEAGCSGGCGDVPPGALCACGSGGGRRLQFAGAVGAEVGAAVLVAAQQRLGGGDVGRELAVARVQDGGWYSDAAIRGARGR